MDTITILYILSPIVTFWAMIAIRKILWNNFPRVYCLVATLFACIPIVGFIIVILQAVFFIIIGCIILYDKIDDMKEHSENKIIEWLFEIDD